MVPLSLIEQLEEFETPVIAESLAAMEHPRKYDDYMSDDIKLLTPMPRPLVGVALTLEVDTSTLGHHSDLDGYLKRLDQMRAMKVPAVLVMKTVGQRPRHECIMGDGMAKQFMSAGCRGVIGDGAARDLPGIARAGLTLFATGLTCDHGSLCYRIPKGPVTVGGVTVRDGDLLHADGNGVRLIPADTHHAIVEACCQTRDFETRAHLINRQSELSIDEGRKLALALAAIRAEKCKAAYARKP